MNINPLNGTRIKGDPRRPLTRVESVEGRHWLHVVQQAASQFRSDLLRHMQGTMAGGHKIAVAGAVADLDEMINTLNGYRRFLAGEGWEPPEGAKLHPWNPIKSHSQEDHRQNIEAAEEG